MHEGGQLLERDGNPNMVEGGQLLERDGNPNKTCKNLTVGQFSSGTRYYGFLVY